MKKLSLLPRAERISIDEANGITAARKGIGEKITDIAYACMTLVGFAFLLIFFLTGSAAVLPFFALLFGAISVFLSFDTSANVRINGRKVENTASNRSPFFYVGAVFIFLGVLLGSGNSALELMIVLIAVFGNVTCLALISAAAADKSKRKRRCTERVYAEPNGYTISGDTTKSNSGEAVFYDEPVYRYYYQGQNYRLIVSKDSASLFGSDSSFEIYIDPDDPQCYYLEQLFAGSTQQVKRLLIVFIIMLAAAFIAIAKDM